MDQSNYSSVSSNPKMENHNYRENLKKQILQNSNQLLSLQSLSQKNEGLHSYQKQQSQQNLYQDDIMLKLEDLNEKSSVKIPHQHYQVIQHQQSQQTLNSLNSSNIFYYQSTITNSENEAIPTNTQDAHIGNEQSDIHNNSKHLSSQSQYNIQAKCVNDYYVSVDNQQQKSMDQESQMNSVDFKSSKCDQSVINKFENNEKYLIEYQDNQHNVDDNDEIRFYSIQYESQIVNNTSINNEKTIQKNAEQIQYDSLLDQVVSINCSQNKKVLNCNQDDSISNPFCQEQQYLDDIQKQNISQNRQENLCESIFSQSVGNSNNDERMQLKIVNEILNFEDQKLIRTLSLNQSCKNSLQNINTNHIDIDNRVANKTMQNLFQTTNDSSDISNLMANIEYTEENVKLFDELNTLNKVIKEFEENIQIMSTQQGLVNQQNRHSKNINNDFSSSRLNNVDVLQDKYQEPIHLKEMINQRKQHLRYLNKELLKIENEREKQKQKESNFIKQVDQDFQKDVDLMNSGLREIGILQQEVIHDIQKEDEHYHNKVLILIQNNSGQLINRYPLIQFKIKLQERKSLGKEELISKLMQRAELVAQMEDFEEIQEDFKQKFCIEAKYILQQFELKKEFEKIQIEQQDLINSKKEQVSLADQIHQQILELNEIFTHKLNSVNDIQCQKTQLHRMMDDKMKTIEEQINKKCISFGLENGDILFCNIFSQRNMTLSKQVIYKQIEQVEKEEQNLNEQYIQEMERIQQRPQLSEFCSSNSILTSQSPQSSPSQSSRSRMSQTMRQLHDSTSNISHSPSKQSLSVHQYLQQDNNQQSNHTSELQKIKETFLIRSSMLRKWKEKARDYLTFLDLQIRSTHEFGVNGYQSSNAYDDITFQNLIRCYFDSSNVQYEESEVDFLTDLYIQYFETLQSQKNLGNFNKTIIFLLIIEVTENELY